MISVGTGVDNSQITCLICVRLEHLLSDFLFRGGVSGFLSFLPFSFPASTNILDIPYAFPVQSPQGMSKNIRKRYMTLKLVGPRLGASSGVSLRRVWVEFKIYMHDV